MNFGSPTLRRLAWAAAAFVVFAALLTGPAAAQSKKPFGGFKHDRTAKIEVVANSLQVVQDQKLAIFEGEVVAGQGTLRLTTDKLAVTYASLEANSDTGEIQHMRADGNVFLVNGDETAKGAWAEYDVAGGMIRMGGSVVLTQGENAISGESLEIDLNAGNAQVSGGRVKSVFSPSDKN